MALLILRIVLQYCNAAFNFFSEHYRLTLLFSLLTIYVVYSTFFHPLRKIPGPFLARQFPGWLAYQSLAGQQLPAVLSAHRKYGDVVRVGPKTVFAGGPEAVRHVLGYGDNYLDKSIDYDALVIHTPSIFSEIDKVAHARKRRIAAHAYSMQSVMKQEVLVQANLDKFIEKMDLCASKGDTVDAPTWFKFYAFDVIGDLGFGRSFGMLDRGVIDEFVNHVSDGIEYTFILFLLPSFLRPLSRFLVRWLPFPMFVGLRDGIAYVRKHTAALVSQRWEKRDDNIPQRADILGALIEANDPLTGERLDFPELATNASTNIIAGSDTITVSLTSILYHLLRHPDCASNLAAEVRHCPLGDRPVFKDVSKLPYLDGCVKEGMRLTSPFSGPMPRVSPPGGIYIGNTHIPQGTVINVMHDQIHRDARIFPDPTTLKPERWFSGQGKELEKYFLGFSTGPRSCIGKNIALLEMKLLLYSLFRRYDMSLLEPERPLVCQRYLITKPLGQVAIRITRAEHSES